MPVEQIKDSGLNMLNHLPDCSLFKLFKMTNHSLLVNVEWFT